MSYINIVDINMEGLLYQVKLTICLMNMSHLGDLNKDKPEGQTVQWWTATIKLYRQSPPSEPSPYYPFYRIEHLPLLKVVAVLCWGSYLSPVWPRRVSHLSRAATSTSFFDICLNIYISIYTCIVDLKKNKESGYRYKEMLVQFWNIKFYSVSLQDRMQWGFHRR